LFITIPEKYGGGRGRCPRCSSELRIPHPEKKLKKQLQESVRYLTDIAVERRPAEDTMIISHEEGPSARYICDSCGESFESLKMDNHQPGECPECSELCQEPSDANVLFSRVTWENGQQTIESVDQEKQGTREITDAIGDISLTFGTSISASAVNSIARLQAQAEAEAREAREKLGETPYDEDEDPGEQYQAVKFTRKVPVVPEISPEEKRKRQRERLRKAVEEARRKADPIPSEQVRIFYEGLQQDADTSVETIRGRIEEMRLTLKKLAKGAEKAIETHVDLGQYEDRQMAKKIREAEARVEHARKELEKAKAAHNKLLENSEYLNVEQESYIQKLKKEATKLQAEVDEALAEAKKEVDERKFMISKIVDGTERQRKKLEKDGQGSGISGEMSIHMQEACEDLLRLISQQYIAVSDVDEKLGVLKGWSKTLDSQVIESTGTIPEAKPDQVTATHTHPKPIHPPDVRDILSDVRIDSGWFYMEDGKEKGPVPLKQIRKLFVEQKLNAYSMLRKEGTQLSGPATSFPELFVGFGVISEPEKTRSGQTYDPEVLAKHVKRLLAIFIILCTTTITHGAIQVFSNLLTQPVHMLIDVIIAASCLIVLSIGGFFLHINTATLSTCPPATRRIGIIATLGLGICLVVAVSLAYLS